MDKEYYRVKVVPFKEVNTRVSVEPKMLWHEEEDIYFTDLPISYHGEGDIKDKLFYLYSELSDEEKEIFKDKVVDELVTIPKVDDKTDIKGKGR